MQEVRVRIMNANMIPVQKMDSAIGHGYVWLHLFHAGIMMTLQRHNITVI